MVGDSVMVGAANALRAALPGRAVHIDAAVARPFAAAVPALSQAAGLGATAAVLHLGTNGPMTDAAFDAAMQTVAGLPRVVVVTIQLPDAAYPHEAPTNDVIRRGAQRWGAVVADWNAATNGRPDLLAKDGYHVSPVGAPVYAQIVAAALR
ncbi:MAG: hypothetical protein S0880_31725 [Actinomycetota bacterium]|nr:hypothetical protein [Actinomycetota bacterium]